MKPLTHKIKFKKLLHTCQACPSQWEYFEDGYGAYVRYRHNRLKVYITQIPVFDFFDCLKDEHLVLCIEKLSNNPKHSDSGYLSSKNLYLILKQHDLLEEE